MIWVNKNYKSSSYADSVYGGYNQYKSKYKEVKTFAPRRARYISKLPLKNGNAIFMTPKPPYYGKQGRVEIDEYLNNLYRQGVRTIVILLENSEGAKELIRQYEDLGFETLAYPIRDFSVPKDLSKLYELNKRLRQLLTRHSVAIHCFGGNGRTGTVVASMLVQMGMAPDEAISLVRKYRPEAIETKDQEGFLWDYEEYLEVNGLLY